MDRLRGILALAMQMADDPQYFPSHQNRAAVNSNHVPPNSPLEQSTEGSSPTDSNGAQMRVTRDRLLNLDISILSSDGDVSSLSDDEDELDDDFTCIQTGDADLIDKFSECFICTNPLQGRGVHQCQTCRKIWCSSCSMRMLDCAFCRTSITDRKANQALTFIVDSSPLPCRYQLNGCSIFLIAKNRKGHEKKCKFLEKNH